MKDIVIRYTYATVVKRQKLVSILGPAWSLSERKKHRKYETAYDVWTWNVWKMKWTRMAQHGCDWTALNAARVCARDANDEIDLMLARNAQPWKPDPLK